MRIWGNNLSPMWWLLLGVVVVLGSVLWRPYGLLIVTILFLVGGAAAYHRADDRRTRILALGAIFGGIVSAVILVFAVGYLVFATSIRQESGVTTQVPSRPLQWVATPTVTP